MARKKQPVAALLDVPFQQAIDYAVSRGSVLPDAYYADLAVSTAARAFTVSHIAKVREIEAILSALNDAIAGGDTFETWQKAAAQEIAELTTPHRETVFRNAVQTAYGAGRREQQVGNESLRPFLMYDAINDSRTRDDHRAMDGFIAPVRDAIWNVWTAPNGHNCRCTCIALTKEQAQSRGYKQGATPPAGRPDAGWDFDPTTERLLERRLQTAVKEALDELPQIVKDISNRVITRRTLDN